MTREQFDYEKRKIELNDLLNKGLISNGEFDHELCKAHLRKLRCQGVIDGRTYLNSVQELEDKRQSVKQERQNALLEKREITFKERQTQNHSKMTNWVNQRFGKRRNR